MTEVINGFRREPTYIALSFAWTPTGTYTDSFGTTHTNAAHNTLLTFTATTVIYDQGADLSGPLSIVGYRWDFGDGIFGYGNPATHTYVIPNLNAQAVLRVTDSKHRQWFTRAQMYLS